MLGFKEYITEDKRVELLVKLEMAKDKIEAHASKSGRRTNTKVYYDLIDRYNNLKDKAIDMGVWDLFCKRFKLSTKHDAEDYYA